MSGKPGFFYSRAVRRVCFQCKKNPQEEGFFNLILVLASDLACVYNNASLGKFYEGRMMKKLCISALCCVLAATAAAQVPFSRGADGEWSELSKWRANYGSGWGAATNFPGVNDSVTVNNDRVLNLDVNTQISTMYLVNNSGDAELNVNSANTLTTSTLNLGHATQTGAASVNQSAGTVNATTAKIGDAGSGTYNLNGGTLFVDGATTINSTGTLKINGGTFTSAHDGTDISITGAGSIEMTDGLWNSVVSAAAPQNDLLITEVDVAVSGGMINLSGQNYFAGEFRVIGNAATISIERLNNSSAYSGDFVFEFDADGVSTVDASGSWINLDSATITVDGSAYTGGAGIFTLFQAANLASTSAVTSVTGFAGGLSGYITQDQDSDMVTLTVIPEPATISMMGAGALLALLIRRKLR